MCVLNFLLPAGTQNIAEATRTTSRVQEACTNLDLLPCERQCIMLRRREKSLVCQAAIPWLSHPQCKHYSDQATAAPEITSCNKTSL